MFDPKERLAGKKIAIVATDGFEESELFFPKEALETAGAEVEILSPTSGLIKSWKNDNWGRSICVDKNISEASAHDYDGLMLPGGVMNADKIRSNDLAIQFITFFTNSGKPIAAICHAAWALIETGAIEGRTMTSWPSLQTDLANAGAKWVNQEVVVDNGWVTSRKPEDLPAFNKKMIEEFSEGMHSDYEIRQEHKAPPELWC